MRSRGATLKAKIEDCMANGTEKWNDEKYEQEADSVMQTVTVVGKGGRISRQSTK